MTSTSGAQRDNRAYPERDDSAVVSFAEAWGKGVWAIAMAQHLKMLPPEPANPHEDWKLDFLMRNSSRRSGSRHR